MRGDFFFLQCSSEVIFANMLEFRTQPQELAVFRYILCSSPQSCNRLPFNTFLVQFSLKNHWWVLGRMWIQRIWESHMEGALSDLKTYVTSEWLDRPDSDQSQFINLLHTSSSTWWRRICSVLDDCSCLCRSRDVALLNFNENTCVLFIN